jgi:hypothetical protein
LPGQSNRLGPGSVIGSLDFGNDNFPNTPLNIF